MIEVYYDNKKYGKQIEYAFKVMGNCCGHKVSFKESIAELRENSNNSSLQITYGKEAYHIGRGIHIYESLLFDDNKYLMKDSIPQLPLHKYNGMPLLFTSISQTMYEKASDVQINMYLDIVQSIFFLLSNYEELVLTEQEYYDMHGRFMSQNRILYQEKYHDKPLINEYVKQLCGLAEQIGLEKFWNMPSNISVHITHDIDHFFNYSTIEHLQMKYFKRVLFGPQKNKVIEGNEIINSIEKENSLVSSWFFKARGNSKYDDPQKLDNKIFLQFVSELSTRGCEVGYHYSYNAATDEVLAEQEANQIRKWLRVEYLCGRNHYLRYKMPKSWEIYDRTGIYYDTTQGDAACEGFLRGICIPYKLFDAMKGRELDVWEIPLIVMDTTLRSELYRNYSPQDALERIYELIDCVQHYSGVFSLLWHNTSIEGEYWEEWFKVVYKPLMEYFGTNSASCRKGIDIIKKYQINN